MMFDVCLNAYAMFFFLLKAPGGRRLVAAAMVLRVV